MKFKANIEFFLGTQSNSESNKITTTPAPLSANNLLQNVVNANIMTKGQMNHSIINSFLIQRLL